MSWAETYGGGGGQNYFCYECNQTVSIAPLASVCPNCNGGFLEAAASPPAVFGGGIPINISSAGELVSNISAHFGGADIQIVLGAVGGGGGLEQLIEQLGENDPNRYGTPPAAKSAVEGLPDVKMLASDSSQCAVCIDGFEDHVVAKQMPCQHIYHSECIIPWLELHNSCPLCRYELPTDDTHYESRRNGILTIQLPFGLTSGSGSHEGFIGGNTRMEDVD